MNINYPINIDKLNEVLRGRQEVANDYSCVIKNSENLKYYKTLINELNSSISSILGNKYLPYEDNLHITAMGLNGFGNLNKETQIAILKTISEFPTISPSSFNIEILDNGLIVCQLFFSDKNKELLKQWRIKFETLGYQYKYENLIHQMHSVIGTFNPSVELPTSSELDDISELLSYYTHFLNHSFIPFNSKNVNLYFFKYTSFLESHAITHI